MRGWYWVLGGCLLLACGGTAVIDAGSSAGGSGGTGAASPMGSGAGAPTSSTNGVVVSSSTGSNPNCITCSEYLLDTTGNALFEDLCGYIAAGDTCAPASSCSLVENLALCTCGDGGSPGMCSMECEFSCTGIGMDSPNCMTCTVTNCAAQANDCLADPGTP